MRVLALVVVGLIVAACGAGAVTPADDVVASAQESLQERESGRMAFVLEASAEGSDTVGFSVRGDYEFGDDELAVVDLTYEIDAGEETVESRIVSDGDVAVIVAGEEVIEVPEEQARVLRVGDGAAPGLPSLDLTSWVRDPEVNTEGKRSEVRGELRAAPFVSDLQRIAAGVAGGTGEAITGEDAERLENAVTGSEVLIVTEGDDHELSSFRATIDFGAAVPAALRDALGRYAGARLALELKIDDIKTPLKVELPD
jgi:hypothetical protein